MEHGGGTWQCGGGVEQGHVGDESYQVQWCSAAIHGRPARPHHH